MDVRQAPVAGQPAKRALNDPPFGQHLKAHLVPEFLHNLNGPTQLVLGPRQQLAVIATIGPNAFEPAPARVFAVLDLRKQPRQHRPRAGHILHIGGGHHHRQHQTQGVHHHMPLAPGYFLAGVITARRPTFALESFVVVLEVLRGFLLPVLQTVSQGQPMRGTWRAPGPWTDQGAGS
jgi:hypothetical protein